MPHVTSRRPAELGGAGSRKSAGRAASRCAGFRDGSRNQGKLREYQLACAALDGFERTSLGWPVSAEERG